MELGALALRATIGPLFIGHGAQKLFGKFGGHGLEGTAGFFESLGLRPGRQAAVAAGTAELAGGALVAAGALTPVGTTLISSTMLTAARTAHAGKGPWTTSGGWEYNVVLVAALTALAERGPGRLSVDAALLPRMRGTGWALLSLAAAAAGSWLVSSRAATQDAEGSVEQEPVSDETREASGRFTRPDGTEPTDTAAAREEAERTA